MSSLIITEGLYTGDCDPWEGNLLTIALTHAPSCARDYSLTSFARDPLWGNLRQTVQARMLRQGLLAHFIRS
ncbi:MAG: hypothetical protein P1P83_00975 [Bacteroidales bacterium]|nr:hypothetical protein [Bacteroidales bacterium]